MFLVFVSVNSNKANEKLIKSESLQEKNTRESVHLTNNGAFDLIFRISKFF